MINKLAVQVIGISVIIAVIIGLVLYARVAVAERDLARSNYEQAQNANEQMVAVLEAERAERERIEEILTSRLERYKEIERKAKERIYNQDAEIKELREKFKEVDTYLSVSVPPAYLQWLRQHTGNGSTDGKDVSTGDAGTADP